LKEGTFTYPDIKRLFSDATFESTMFAREKAAWQAFRDVVTKFLGNRKDPNYTNTFNKILDAFKDLDCNMNLKFHFLHSHLDYFAENLRSLSEGQRERLHTDVKDAERRYQGRWNISMLADYCWLPKQEVPEIAHRRKVARKNFATKKVAITVIVMTVRNYYSVTVIFSVNYI
jgi:hypothetical protein